MGNSRAPERDSLSWILGFGKRQTRAGFQVGLVGTLLLHGVAGATAALTGNTLVRLGEATQAFVLEDLRARYDIDLEQPPPKPPEPEPEPPEPVPEPEPAAPVEQNPNEPPPPPAEAGQVLAAEADPNEPVDLTGNTFVVGSSTSYAGGITTSTGTSKTAVRSGQKEATEAPRAAGGGQVGPARKGPSLKRPALPARSGEWGCGHKFPPEAELEQINEASVRLTVTVDKSGKAMSVALLSDPGFGFGRMARQCALAERFVPGLDDDGNPVAQSTPPITVRFTR